MTSDNFAPLALSRVESEVNLLVNRIDKSTDNAAKGEQFIAHFVGNILEKRGAAMKAKAVKAFKTDYAEQLKKPTDGSIALDTSQEIVLTAKVMKPRESFDLDAYIATLAEKFDMSRHSLQTIADQCTKKSAAPVSFTTSLVTEKSDD